MKEKYRYRVSCESFEPVEVVAVDRLWAVSAAGQAWGVPWTSVARHCVCERLEQVKEDQPAKEAPAKKSTGKKPAARKK